MRLSPCVAYPSSPGSNPLGQREQQRRPVASKRAAVHAGERRRPLARDPLENARRVRRVREVIERRTELLARLEDIRFRERYLAGSALREEIAAQKRARRCLEHEP